MANSYEDFNGDNSNTDFTTTVPYLAASHISTTVDAVVETNYIWLSSTQIRFTTPPPTGTNNVRILRTTPTAPLTNFVDGASLNEDDLDRALLQSLYVSEEAADVSEGTIILDGLHWDARTKNIQDVLDPVLAQDAVTKAYLEANALHDNGTTNYDAQSSKLVNLSTPTAGGDAVNKTYADSLLGAAISSEEQVATASQTVFTLVGITYTPGINNLTVFINGVHQASGSYTETSTTVVTFSEGLELNDLVVFHTAEIITTTTSASSVSVYTPAGAGAVATNVQTKLRESVSVVDFGVTGDGVTDDTVAFQLAADYGGTLNVPAGNYVITGEVTFGSNTTLEVANGAVFTMDCSGSNGRGLYFEEATNSGIRGDFKINASATSLGSDGSLNSCIQFGNGVFNAAPSITRFCFITGNVEIRISGTSNVKGVYLSGWVEDMIVEGVSVTGKTNYAITAHWSKDVSSGLPTKTWHGNNITVRNCRIYQETSFDKPLRGYTFSASGRVVIDNCIADTTTLSYNLFVGDYGYTYAQNITNVEAYKFTVRDCFHMGGDVAITADSVSAGVDSSPTWTGATYNANVLINGFECDANDSTDGLMLAFTGVKDVVCKNINLYSTNAAHTREFFYAQLCGSAYLNGTFVHNEYARFATTGDVILDGCLISKDVATPDVTSYSVTLTGVSSARVVNSTFKDSRSGVFSTDNFDKSIDVSNCTFENIGLNCLDINYCDKLTINGNIFKDVATTTTTVNIYSVNLDVSVTGFVVSNNVFGTNDSRYIIYIGATCGDGSIHGNTFMDLNAAASSPSAVFINAAATNVRVDAATNVVASTIVNLVYPLRYDELATGTYTLDLVSQSCEIDSVGGAVTATLGKGSQPGATKVVVMTNSTASSTLSVSNHATSNPEVVTFTAVDDTWLGMWTGTEWVTVSLVGATV